MVSDKYQPQPQPIASYSFTDIASGTGMVKFYGYKRETNTTESYGLSTDTIATDTQDDGLPYLAITSLGSPLQIVKDIDLDTSPFNLPRTAEGTAIFSFAMGVEGGAGGGTVKVIVKLRKWDGVTETEIGSVESKTITSATKTVRRVNLPLEVPKTRFKIGETLRVTIEVWGTDSGAGGTMYLGLDPEGSEVSSTTIKGTQINYIPFRVDL